MFIVLANIFKQFRVSIIFNILLNEAECDVWRYADQGGCYLQRYIHKYMRTYIFYWLVPTGLLSFNVTIIIKNTHRRLKTRKLIS